MRQTQRELEAQIITLEERLGPHNLAEYQQAKSKLEELYNKITEGIIVRSRTQWYEQGEKNNKYFLGLEKKLKVRSCIRKLITEADVEITNNKSILSEIKRFYTDRFTRKINVTEEECDQFLGKLDINPVEHEEVSSMGSLITPNEVRKVLKLMPNNKAPGNDGLSREFYWMFFDIIINDLISSLNESYDLGALTISQRQAVITIIEKDGKDNR